MKKKSWREKVGWLVHNLIAHPLSEIIYWLGLHTQAAEDLGNWVHDITVPQHTQGEGRG